jgi:hypothetical protein
MEEQKNFKYEGDASFKASNKINIGQIDVEDVRFLMPVRIDINVNNKPMAVFAKMDLTNKEIYFDLDWLNDDLMKEKVFEHLKIKTTLPENHYEADQKVYSEVDRANAEQDQLKSNKETYE